MRSFGCAAAGVMVIAAAATRANRIGRRMDGLLQDHLMRLGKRRSGAGSWAGSERPALRRNALQLSVGKPPSFQALMPPARWASYCSPAACAISDAVTDRLPERQANTTRRPWGSGITAGSNSDIGRENACG